MKIKLYERLLTLLLLTTIVSTFIGQIEYYNKLQPTLDVYADSISIPLFYWAVFLLSEGIFLWLIQWAIAKKISKRNIDHIKNEYCNLHRNQYAIFLIPLIFSSWHFGIWLNEIADIGILYFGVIYTSAAVCYSMLFANYLVNLLKTRGLE